MAYCFSGHGLYCCNGALFRQLCSFLMADGLVLSLITEDGVLLLCKKLYVTQDYDGRPSVTSILKHFDWTQDVTWPLKTLLHEGQFTDR